MSSSRVAAVILLVIVALAAAQVPEHSENSLIETEPTPGIVERVQNYVSSNVLEPLREMDWRELFRGLLDQVMEYMAPAQQQKEPKTGEYHVGQERAAVVARRLFSGLLHIFDSFTS